MLPGKKNVYRNKKGESWYYLGDKEMQTVYPNGGAKIFADIHKKEKQDAGDHLIGKDTAYGLYPYHGKCSKSERVIGYIAVESESGEDGFIRIIGTAWTRLLLAVFALVMCVTIFLFGMWYAKKDEVPGLDKTAVSYHIDGVENKDKDSILLPGIKVINAKEDDTHIEAVLMNPAGNGCYFTYSIILEQSGDTLYTSGMIEPGKAVTQFDINTTLKAGKYPIKIYVQTRDVSNPDIVYNGGALNAELTVTK